MTGYGVFKTFALNNTGMADFDRKDFLLKDDYFDHPSLIHGINHTYRVMYHVLRIGRATGLVRETLQAWCAAYIHDMARKHDGYCTEHGQWSAEKKFPEFKSLFIRVGVDADGLEAVRLAVVNHSQRHEIDPGHPYYKTVALLKDADALDRIRIGENNLKVEYLRFDETLTMVDFAKELYYRSDDRVLHDFDALLRIAKTLPGISQATGM